MKRVAVLAAVIVSVFLPPGQRVKAEEKPANC
jgi:hypothetical protein